MRIRCASMDTGARREIGKWLNEQPSREIDRQALAELCAEYDLMRHELLEAAGMTGWVAIGGIMDWVSVKDRLPEVDDKTGESAIVICSWIDFRGRARVDAFALCCDSDGCLWGFAEGLDDVAPVTTDDDDYQVTHWMPVPKPVEQPNK